MIEVNKEPLVNLLNIIEKGFEKQSAPKKSGRITESAWDVYRVSSLIQPDYFSVLKEAFQEKYTPQFNSMMPAFIGTAVHEYLAKMIMKAVYNKKNKELRAKMQAFKIERQWHVRFARFRFGIKCYLSGTPDLYLDDVGALIDFKVTDNLQSMNNEHSMQLNMYRYLLSLRDDSIKDRLQYLYIIFFSRKDGLVVKQFDVMNLIDVENYVVKKIAKRQNLKKQLEENLEEFIADLDFPSFQRLLWHYGDAIKIFNLSEEIVNKHAEELCTRYQINQKLGLQLDEDNKKILKTLSKIMGDQRLVTFGKNVVKKIPERTTDILDTALIREKLPVLQDYFREKFTKKSIRRETIVVS